MMNNTMTEEQIKQAAENFIEAINKERVAQGYKALGAGEEDLVFNAYFAGAHSRDEEIKELRKTMVNLAEANQRLECIVDKLQNPWISVEDRLPENGDMVLTRSVLIIKGGGERSENEQFHVQKFVGYWLTDCCKQYRMHEFTLDKVTHWMPIPELKKGE